MSQEKINTYTINGPGSFTIESDKGNIRTIPTSYSFGNDISHGEIDNSIKRVQHLQRSEHITMNHNMTVEGTAQNQVGGIWYDVGSPELHTGQAQRAATMTNKELYSLISNYPDRDDGEPIYIPFPSLTECLKEAEQITSEQTAPNLPTISTPTDIAKWIGAFAAHIGNQITQDRSKQMAMAAQLMVEKKEKQIQEQKKYLTEKYGEVMYETLFKAQVEMGAVYNKPYNNYSVTKQDIYQAAFADGKAEKRNAFAAKIG